MAYDQVFIIATKQTKPTVVSAPTWNNMWNIQGIFVEDIDDSNNVYIMCHWNCESVLPSSLVLDLGAAIPVNTLELSKFFEWIQAQGQHETPNVPKKNKIKLN